MEKTEWSDLPEELLDLIANRYSSNIDVLRIRSTCKSWRSAVAMSKERLQFRFERYLPTSNKKIKAHLSPTTFFRITLPSSCPNKGWLVRTRQASKMYRKITLLCPLSGERITRSHQTLDLLKVGVSEIRQSYEIQIFDGLKDEKIPLDSEIFSNYIKNSDKIPSEGSRSWTKIKNQVEDFSDIILHMGRIYAVDLKGAIWWISLSQLTIVQQTSSTPLDYYKYDSCQDTRLVEYCGDLCIVHELSITRNHIQRTVGFKVYKMDEDLAKWVEVSCLGDNTLIVACNSCFTVVASEYHGCLKNSIYFSYYDVKKAENIKVFKLDDGSITQRTDISSQSCFHMFSLPFLNY
ncbi:F-box SKIP23-like protein (DUF295) [Arabidopsis thaliana]|uniref:F-box SKIP23-like protein (DUF295) n=1 Tax=Arabidopsis thaliana TaxID=3702 RepID=UPI0000163548|nr:F-box SKIP23-like protein (DUF295) [Arabidopsis thaliana]AEE77064.1 F-box SKIP23-like protein (DUF295) [Arabidopsis thaliana]|eukprot:NP_189203.1 F-box SKIP23-like protein (DUF295) [Arabidopsis thaliana]